MGELNERGDKFNENDMGVKGGYIGSPRHRCKILREFLIECGFNPYLTGFDYLIDTVVVCSINPDLLRQKTKLLYPKIGKIHNVHKDNVERNIRTLIQAAWKSSRRMNFCVKTNYMYLIEDNRKPTCGEIINILESYVQTRLNDIINGNE